jgi:lysozyme family protein
MSNFPVWWRFCMLPGNDGQANDISPGEPFVTRWGFTFPTWIAARRYAGFRDATMATFNAQTQDQMGQAAYLFFWSRQGGNLMRSGEDVSVIDWLWTSGGAVYDIQRALDVSVDGRIGPQTVAAMRAFGGTNAVMVEIHAMRLQYYEDCGLIVSEGGGSYSGDYPGLGLRADACLKLAEGLVGG